MLASLLLEPGRLELRDIEIPKAGPGEVVVRVRTALTCGTELKTFRRGHPKIPTPTPLGHEFSGDVYEVGEGVRKFRTGDQVMTAPTAPSFSMSRPPGPISNTPNSPRYGLTISRSPVGVAEML